MLIALLTCFPSSSTFWSFGVCETRLFNEAFFFNIGNDVCRFAIPFILAFPLHGFHPHNIYSTHVSLISTKAQSRLLVLQ